MAASERIGGTLGYVIIVIMTFAALQSIVVVMHEFTHSTVAWLLGCMPSPLGIVWGNPLMMTGWDEGVHYSKLFPSGHHAAEAIIGGSPLVLHTIIVTLGIIFLKGRWLKEKKWLYHTIYWFVIANFMELIAYIVMRPFASGGDTGHFNRGLGLSPWILFIAGTLVILVGLYILFRKILPRMYAAFAQGNRLTEWMIFSVTAFLLFLWGSGLRVVFYIYPDPQWMFGLLGFAAFGIVLFTCNPSCSR
ncbi:MAG: hypothetical protein JXR85_01270 [Deltaproteobacteria bacterium]|nr:hypothetical protein [Deltaproteobacteria bacterium]